MSTLAEQLDAAMREAYAVTGKETGYWGRYFLRSVKKHGGLATAKRMLGKRLNNPSEQKGFRALVESGRPDLSLESLVLQKRFRELFSSEELAEAERRLGTVPGYAKRKPVDPSAIYAEDLLTDVEYTEGAKKHIIVSAYERDPRARAACIKKYGCSCQVCGMRFEEVYGDIGRGFIHVHHRKPLAGRRSNYKVRPTIDLAPVCPNCHAMLHSSSPPLGIEELKKRIAGRKNNPRKHGRTNACRAAK